MVGMFLKDREVQYVAHKDETTNTWRILDTWHEDLVNLGPDDDVEDDSKAITILTEGGFIALVKEAARLGAITNSSVGGDVELEQELLDENDSLKSQVEKLEGKLSNIPEHAGKSEGFILKEMAMQTLLKLTSMSDIENLTKD